MKNQLHLSILLLFVSIIIMSSCENESSIWKETLKSNSIEGYEEFLQKYPNGSFKDSAQIILIDLYFENANGKDSIGEYAKIIERFKSSSFSDKVDSISAEKAIEIIQKDTSIENIQLYLSEILNVKNQVNSTSSDKSSNEKTELTILAYDEFLKKYPRTPLKKTINDSLIELQWGKALKANTKEIYQDFIQNYPESKYREEAEVQLFSLKTTYEGTITSCEIETILGNGSGLLTGEITTIFWMKLKEYPKINFYFRDWTQGAKLLPKKGNNEFEVSDCKGIKVKFITKASKKMNKQIISSSKK